MGTFTTDPAAIQTLFAAGIPVWWLQLDLSILSGTHVRAVVALSELHNKCLAIAPGYGDVLYHGLAGPKHLEVLSRGGHTYQDVSRSVLLAVDVNCGYGSPESQKEFKRGSGEKANTSVSGRHTAKKSLQTKHPHPCKCFICIVLL